MNKLTSASYQIQETKNKNLFHDLKQYHPLEHAEIIFSIKILLRKKDRKRIILKLIDAYWDVEKIFYKYKCFEYCTSDVKCSPAL